jgi:hypothetical protein
VLWKKTEIVHPSIFPSKTNVWPCHSTRIDVPMRHLSPCHLNVQTTSMLAATLLHHLRRKLNMSKFQKIRASISDADNIIFFPNFRLFLALIPQSLSFSPKSLSSLLVPFNLPPKLNSNI